MRRVSELSLTTREDNDVLTNRETIFVSVVTVARYVETHRKIEDIRRVGYRVVVDTVVVETIGILLRNARLCRTCLISCEQSSIIYTLFLLHNTHTHLYTHTHTRTQTYTHIHTR